MASSSSTSKNSPRKHKMLNEEQRSSSNSNCLIIMPQFIQSPFFRQQQQPMNLKPNNFQLLTTTSAATQIVGQIHNSIVSTADRFFNFMQILGSQNPLIGKLLSFSSHLQSFRAQVCCRNSGTLDNRLLNHNFAAILPGDSVAGIVATNGILNFLSIYNTVLIVRLVLTWFPNAPPAIVSPLSTVCDPYLNIFRGIIPPLGGLDLSPILAFLVLNAFTSAASALPAELPKTGVSQNLSSDTTNLTTSQKKWMMRRVAGNKPKCQSGEN